MPVAAQSRDSAVSEPAFQIGPMHDAEHENDPVFVDNVVHHAMIANAESVKRVRKTLDGLDRLTADAAGLRGLVSELVECVFDPCSVVGRQFPEDLRRAWSELDPIGTQPRSRSLSVRPLA